MKISRIINGRKYDTETATLVATHWNGRSGSDFVEYKGYTLRKVGPFSNCYTFLCSNGEKKLCASLREAKKYVDYLRP